MKKAIPVAMIYFFSGLAQANEIVDLKKIAGKSEAEVSAYLGNPVSCGKSKQGKTCQYAKGETEIVYIQSKADWITVEGIDSVDFGPSALMSLGLKAVPPSFKNELTMWWHSISGMKELSLFKGTSKSDYAYIKVKTE